MNKKTKIVATIGPVSESIEILEEMIVSGMNVCRLNFSHGTHDEHLVRINAIKKARENQSANVAIMLDTKGPEIRIKTFEDNKSVVLETGRDFTLTTRDVLGNDKIVSITYIGLPSDVSVGNTILIDDGLVELEVVSKNETDINCKVINGGTISNRKGINVPSVKINIPALTDSDIEDILFGIKQDIDFIAASFIRKPEDVLAIRRILEDNNSDHIEIISKIENQEGVENLDDIIRVSDGIMVARGDLGVEIAPEEIPIVQKDMISKCNLAGKPVITATQMLDSMMRNPRPTRAEVTDVANAILDGTSAIMLSGETAAGKYPILAVKMMSKIACRVESSLDYHEILRKTSDFNEITTTNAIGKATCTTAYDLSASAIIAATASGYTARVISKFKPKSPIIAATTSPRSARKLSLDWGVFPVISELGSSTDEILDYSITAAQNSGYIKDGDLVVITAGVPVGTSGSTNLIKVHTLGKLLISGTGIGNMTITGRVVVGTTEDELLVKFEPGDILVTTSTAKEVVSIMKKASAVVAEDGGLTSHAAIAALNLNIPTIVGARNATEILKDGDIITLDSSTGQIYRGQARLI
ncbi:MAG: pyruvate kinase [Tissierellia bacterium]|nr:pyruvate kinase [Tissierellia bacterium]